MHDYDNNTKLDGLELLKSMTHHHEDDEEGKCPLYTETSKTMKNILSQKPHLECLNFAFHPTKKHNSHSMLIMKDKLFFNHFCFFGGNFEKDVSVDRFFKLKQNLFFKKF